MRTISYPSLNHKGEPVIITVQTYDAPHKLQPTPRKLHRARKAWDQLKSSTFGRTRPCFGGRV